MPSEKVDRTKLTERLHSYEIVSLLDSTRSSIVYRAKNRLGSDVAIKFFTADDSLRDDVLARFANAVRASSSLNHPRIIKMYEAAVADRTPYLVMEYVEGRALSAVISEGPIPLTLVIEIAAQISDGLAAIHEAQLVHSRLRPENIIVDANGAIKLIDFAGSEFVDRPNVDELSRVADPTASTRVAYMSPEQVTGERLDGRSDLFTLGSILYELIAGRRPFERERAIDTLHAIKYEQPRPVAELRPGIPDNIVVIIRRLLEKSPDRRYILASDVALDLRTLTLPSPSREEDVGALAAAGSAADATLTTLTSIIAETRDFRRELAESSDWARAFVSDVKASS